jgi:hypothetical protein
MLAGVALKASICEPLAAPGPEKQLPAKDDVAKQRVPNAKTAVPFNVFFPAFTIPSLQR